MGRFDITGLGIGIVLASAVTAASAQTVISREVTTEPVETIVTQGPDGSTIVSRRPLGTQAETVYGTPSSRVVETVETVERPAAPTVRRQAIRQGTTTQGATTTRVERKQAQQPRNQTIRTTRRTTTTQAAAPLSLTPDDRRIVYQTVVRERPVPQVVTRDVVTQPAPHLAYRSPMTTVVEPVSPVVEAVDSYVGMSLPQNVEYYDVPESLAVRLPATRSYHYAYVDDRVLLVDPVSHVVVADITDQ